MQSISVYDLTQNPFQLIGKQWALITTRRGEKTTTMTASWGGVGVLWNKPVAYIFLRPQRFSRELLDDTSLFSACFVPEEFRSQLGYCGAHSGRNEDKLAACGFTSGTLDGAPVISEAELVLTCRKLYRQQFDPACFIDQSLDAANYPGKDYHILYVAEILGAYQK